ncbi:MAG TPA: AMP-binding protein, partial [Sphingopyxis sp.]|nr:AMP-binding protein [Sphingopyxis sp.]
MKELADLLTFDEFITHWAADRPARVALREEDRVFTYADLDDLTAKVASALFAAGLRKGDRIAWIGKNSDLYFLLFFGAARAGIVMAPIGWRLSPAEWAYVLNDTGAKILFTGPGFDAAAQQLAGKLEQDPLILGAAEARARIAATPRAGFEGAGPDDAVLQLYTSGTTGNPKGAVLS